VRRASVRRRCRPCRFARIRLRIERVGRARQRADGDDESAETSCASLRERTILATSLPPCCGLMSASTRQAETAANIVRALYLFKR
jgi:hypothetical protein